MSTQIEDIRRRLEKINNINSERLRVKALKDNELNDLYNLRDKYRQEIETVRFVVEKSAEYYKDAREENLKGLEAIVGDFMSNVLDKEYEVSLKIKRSGNYDYLDVTVNGLEPKDLSGGETQVYSLAMISECVGNNILVLDETINSLDPIAQKKIIYYLEKLAETKQVIIVELDDNLEIPYTYWVENNSIFKEDTDV